MTDFFTKSRHDGTCFDAAADVYFQFLGSNLQQIFTADQTTSFIVTSTDGVHTKHIQTLRHAAGPELRIKMGNPGIPATLVLQAALLCSLSDIIKLGADLAALTLSENSRFAVLTTTSAFVDCLQKTPFLSAVDTMADTISKVTGRRCLVEDIRPLTEPDELQFALFRMLS